ncbi:taste receptor type 2 member 105-like [Anolis carolinensis]|uniref:taste receptor type 2 member 105-like n=1 Tax=Anolis carolinensis TaxID=28377 RepID=UPI002F2B7118
MPSIQIFVFLLAVADLGFGGLISNGFIATVTIREWTKHRRLASSEQLFLSLALSNICSTILTILYFWVKIFPTEFQSNTTGNVTSYTQVKFKDYLGFFRLLFLIIGSSSPLIVVLFCSIMVIASLSRHVCRMASTTSSFKDLQTEAHIKAVWIVLFLLFLYVSYFMAHTWSIVVEMATMEMTFASFVLITYSPAQAAVLIFTNPKLREAFNQLLQRKRSLEG